jgi:hypothetical protein
VIGHAAASGVSPAAVAAAAAAAALPWREGDAELARRVLEQTRSATTPAGPHAGEYFSDVLAAAMRWIFELIARVFSGASGIGPVIQLLVLLLAAAALVLGVMAIVRRTILRRRRRRQLEAGEGGSRVTAEDAVASGPRDAAAWRAELDARLARGEVPEALEALWWWLAQSLASDSDASRPVDASWTTRDVFDRAQASARGRARARARGGDLGRLADELDALMYGRVRPSPSDVSASVRRVEGVLA